MPGHLRRRSKGSWTIILELPRDPLTGRRRQRQLTVRGTKQQATAKLHELAAQVDTGSYADAGKITVAAYLERWLNDFVRPPHKDIRTYETYRGIVDGWAKVIGGMQLSQLQPMHLQKFYRRLLDKGRSSTTVQHYHAVMHKALRDAVRMQLLTRNVADAVDAPKIRRKAMPLPKAAHLAKLIETAEGRWIQPIIRFALATGMRAGEIAGLKWADVDLDHSWLHVQRVLVATEDGALHEKEYPKNRSSRRRLALGKEAVALLRRYHAEQAKARLALGSAYDDHGLVWCWPTGKPISPKTMSSNFGRQVKAAEIPHITFHDLRHLSATLLLEAGVHPKVVQDRLGHSTFMITMDLYSHVAPSLQDEAAAALDSALSGILGGQMEGKMQKRAAPKSSPKSRKSL